MLGIDRQAARITWTVLVILLLVAAIYTARRPITVFVIALLFAYMLSPLVEWLHSRTPKRVPKTLSLAVVYVALIAVIAIAGVQIGSRLAEEASNFAKKAPDLLKQQHNVALDYLPGWLRPYGERIIASVRDQFERGAEQAVPFLQSVGGHVATILGSIGLIALVPILSFFFLKDSTEMRDSFLSWFPSGRPRRIIDQLLDDFHLVIGKYMRAVIILSIAAFTAYFVFFEIARVPYGVLLAAIGAPLELIPVLGPLTAGLIMIAVAIVSGYPHVIWIVVFLLVYRMFQDYMLSPYLMSEGVELHPLLVIFGVLAGDEIAGIPGMFLSVPVLALLRVVLVRISQAKAQAKIPQ